MFKIQEKEVRKICGAAVMGAALVASLVTNAPNANAQKMTINGKTLKNGVAPIKRAGRTLVGMRSIFEGLGVNVQWNPGDKSIIAKGNGMTVQMKIGSSVALVNGQPVQLEQAPSLHRGNTMVPLRFVSESMGARVNYDAATRDIAIATDGNAGIMTNAATGKVPLTLDKSVYVPYEPMKVSFRAPMGMKKDSTVRIIPSDMPRGGEVIMKANAIAHRYLGGKTQGVLEFRAPLKLGSYDLRVSDKTNEVGFAQFEVAPTTPSVTPTISIGKGSYKKGEMIIVKFTAFSFYNHEARLSIVPAGIPHGDQKLNVANEMGHGYLGGRTQGTAELRAPGKKSGSYDIRLNDNFGNEIATTQVFTVE